MQQNMGNGAQNIALNAKIEPEGFEHSRGSTVNTACSALCLPDGRIMAC